ncbi:Anaphase-promoting complex subunit 2, C-terminal [Dillenia turbinata]|uniref:Anaphase-promoting complex subunit 2, C-terminal n=1 Tax=Dillenia turbinata TaxID=194707 RepID=A0AAN8YV83_9MAGN
MSSSTLSREVRSAFRWKHCGPHHHSGPVISHIIVAVPISDDMDSEVAPGHQTCTVIKHIINGGPVSAYLASESGDMSPNWSTHLPRHHNGLVNADMESKSHTRSSAGPVIMHAMSRGPIIASWHPRQTTHHPLSSFISHVIYMVQKMETMSSSISSSPFDQNLGLLDSISDEGIHEFCPSTASLLNGNGDLSIGSEFVAHVQHFDAYSHVSTREIGEQSNSDECQDRDEKSKRLRRSGEMEIDAFYRSKRFSENNKLVKNIVKVVSGLRSLGFTSITEDAYASAIFFLLLKAKVQDLAGNDYRNSILESIKEWKHVFFLGTCKTNLILLLKSAFCRISLKEAGMEALEYFAYETLQDLRIAKLFEIIVDYPDRKVFPSMKLHKLQRLSSSHLCGLLTFSLVDSMVDSGKSGGVGGGHCEEILLVEEDGDRSVASVEDQPRKEMTVYEKFILGMLTNFGSMALERIHNTLKIPWKACTSGTSEENTLLQMFCVAGPAYDKSLQQPQSSLSDLVSEEKLELRDGMYLLK